MTNTWVRLPLKAEGISLNREVILAEPLSQPDRFRVISIPAYVYGLARGDTVRILNQDSGEFEVVMRGGQVAIRMFLDGSLERPDVKALVDSICDAGGFYEVGRNATDHSGASLLMISLDINMGFSKIEALMHTVKGPDVKWEYGNVYDVKGDPMNWWIR